MAAQGSPRKQARQARSLSINIGLNSVGGHYMGWTGPLVAGEFDARDLAALAESRGIKPMVLLTKNATREKVLAALRTAASTLVRGDFFLITFSGHGGQVPDLTGTKDSKLQNTWCLHDGQLLEAELFQVLGSFAIGARVLVIDDSCHSGTVVRAGPPAAGIASFRSSKMMPPSVAMRTYEAHKGCYDKLQADLVKADTGIVVPPHTDKRWLARLAASGRLFRRFNPSAILISGSQHNQSAYDGDRNGAFVARLLAVWNHGTFDGNYSAFHAHIVAGMPAIQTPSLVTIGSVLRFLKQKPFTV